MVARTVLYDAFGDLIYAVCMADGHLSAREVETYTDLLEGYEGAKHIHWSFDYEHANKKGVEDAFSRGIDVCKENGPDPEYARMIEVLNAVSESDGVHENEWRLINRFVNELKEQFIKDLEK